MNKIKRHFLLVIIIGLVLYSCKKESTITPAPNPTLGFNGTGNALGVPDANGNSCTYNMTYGANQLGIVIQEEYQYIHGSFEIAMTLHVNGTGTYILSNKKNVGDFNQYEYNGEFTYITDYFTDSIHTGQFTLTSFDTIKHLASGTFWFVGQNHSSIPSQDGLIDSVKNGFFTNLTW